MKKYLSILFCSASVFCSGQKNANHREINSTPSSGKNKINDTAGSRKLYKIWRMDTSYVNVFLNDSMSPHCEDCKKLFFDSHYWLKKGLLKKGDWEIFYDKQLEVKFEDYYVRNDTTYTIEYYQNGKAKSETKYESDRVGGHWVYHAAWCENGQLQVSYNPNNRSCSLITRYYCNGNKRSEGKGLISNEWGTWTTWYESGQLRSVKKYTEYGKELGEVWPSAARLLSARYWDENGNQREGFNCANGQSKTTETIPQKNLDSAGSPWSIKGMKEYDGMMSMFSEEVYSRVKLHQPCKCNCGYVGLVFTIDKNGVIGNITLDEPLESNVDKAFLDAVKQIGTWTPAKIDGKAVDMIIMLSFSVARIKK